MKLTKKAKILILVALGAVLLAGGAGTAWVIHQRRQRSYTPEEAYAQGKADIEAGRPREAFQLMGYAAQNSPANVEYNWAAAKLALDLGDPKTAFPYAERAWSEGMRTAEVLRALVSGTEFTGPGDRLKRTLKWYEKLPEDEKGEELEADLRFDAGDHEEAVRLWESAFREAPTSGLANKIARGLIRLKRYDPALEFLKRIAGTEQLDGEGYGWLGTLLMFGNQTAQAEKAFLEGRKRYPESESLRLRQADFLMTRDRPADAAAVLAPMKPRADDRRTDLLHHRARLYLGAVLAIQARKEGFDELTALAEGDLPWLEGERLFYRGLKETIAGEAAGVETLARSRRLLAPHPALEMVYAEALVLQGRWADAADVFQAIPGTLGQSPRVLLAYAEALQRSNRPDEALKTLSRLHARGVYSKSSLELFRNLAFRKNLTREGRAAQKLLEEKFKDDPGVQLSSGLMALQSGRLQEAAATLDALATRHPEREDVETARLSVLLAKKEYAELLRECEKSTVTPARIAPFRARALIRLGRNAEARKVLEDAASAHPVPAVLLPYGNLLLASGEPANAAPHFAAVLEADPDNTAARLGAAVVDLGAGRLQDARAHIDAVLAGGDPVPYAHLLLADLEIREGHPNRALTAAHRVLARTPNDPRAIFLQALAYLGLGRLDDAQPLLTGLIEKLPDVPAFRLQLARLSLIRNQPEKALEAVDAALARKSVAEGPARLAFTRLRIPLLGRTGKTTDARSLLESIADRLSAAEKAALDARLFEQEGKPDDAIAALRPHLDVAPLAIQWAELSLRRSRPSGVIDAVAPHAPDLATWIRLAVLARENGEAPTAAEAYRHALRLDSENAALLNNYAWNAMQSDTFDSATVLDAARKAHIQLPTNPSVVHTYATALLKSGRTRDCVDLLQKDAAATRKAAKLLFVLAQAHEARQEQDRAINVYTECLNHPDTADVKEGNLARPSLQKRIADLQNRK